MRNLSDIVLLPQPRKVGDARGVCRGDAEPTARRDGSLPAQGYRLLITPDHITVESADETGAHHAAMTLRQLRRAAKDGLPCGAIEDWPDFATRGVMLDISRDKVPTLATLFRLVDEFSEWKLNRLELYTEHTFAYRNHRVVWQYADPMTAGEVRELDAYCRARHIELVPNQNCFGHLAHWLKHPGYRGLAEAPDGHTAWGEWRPYPFSLNPLDPRSLGLVGELLGELLPNFTSTKVNVGCDETVDLGQGRSRTECERVGRGRVYLDFLLKIHALTARLGRTMHFWGDIILHHPELIPELPRDAVAMVWGYEADHPFERECSAFSASGLPFFVCPGTSSWNSITGRTSNMRANIRSASEHGRKHGAQGLVVTDWGDNGHWQQLPFSYPGFACAAAAAWCLQSNRDALLQEQLDAHVFRDAARVAGGAVLALGEVHRLTSCPRANATELFWLLRGDDVAARAARFRPGELEAVRKAVREAVAPLPAARMEREDAACVRREIATGAWMTDAACRRTERKGVCREETARMVQAMRSSWRERFRAGGLDDSMGQLERRLA